MGAVSDAFEALLAAGDGLVSEVSTTRNRAASVGTAVDGDSHFFAVLWATQGAFDVGGFHNPSRFEKMKPGGLLEFNQRLSDHHMIRIRFA